MGEGGPRGYTMKRDEELLQGYRGSTNWLGEGNTQRLIGDEHRLQNRPEAALAWYYKALSTYQRGGHAPLEEARTLKAIGYVQFLMHRNGGALESYDDALKKYEKLQIKSPLGEADTRKARAD